ncbi:DUF732 domain-containing protein [Mycobacterium ulcerans]|uniref:DUF732 domain-containing protein n=2 Tax=Mycobacterium ulcerans TaxID=1809 RepID=A0ABY3V1X3_MYCUL|nr:DUF732 domain-containing protein [Mycobacterium ulcerans]MEB3906203.1 DUF732 domain-containing protein [Mycobacterium ulcerans]MEB3910373.1 DUF732 domain-containing protein [Mycobacterium ulcerans]MEB3920619.1 DUF732 domain-containing protein [Mycobacterium ulcerans]MEB3924706.1 DUF732 domain-containing protein [Mycobacterium ulcerans]MEB3928889.1 DUF732 domain-containing protein [Mycobacterium ulcerans]
MKLLIAVMDVCAAVVFGAPVWVAGVARAGDDVGFLVALQRIGITYPSPAQAIDAARAVCVCLDRGESGLAVVQEVTARNPGFDMDAAAHFAVISTTYYCPHHLAVT